MGMGKVDLRDHKGQHRARYHRFGAKPPPGAGDEQRRHNRADAEQAQQHAIFNLGAMQLPAHHRGHQRLIAGHAKAQRREQSRA